MEKIKKVIDFNASKLGRGYNLNELPLTKKQKMKMLEIVSDILFRFRKMKYNRINYFVIGNKKHCIIVDVVILTRTKAISFSVEFRDKEEKIKHTLICDRNIEYQESFNFKDDNYVYKRFLSSKNIFFILLEKKLCENNSVSRISYFIVKELKNTFKIKNLYSDENIIIPKEFKDKMLEEIEKLEEMQSKKISNRTI